MAEDDARPTAAEQLLADITKDLVDYTQEQRVESLAAYIEARYHEAASRRAAEGIDEQVAAGMRALRKQFSPREIALMMEAGEGAADAIYSGVTETKARGGRAWLLDILANAKDKPFTIEPTPMPELPPAAEDAIVERLYADVAAQYGPDAAAIPAEIEERASRLKNEALKRAKELAKAAAIRVEQRIHDRITESGWRSAFESFALDIMIYPAAIVKGPYIAVGKRLKWQDGRLAAVAVPEYRISRVAPEDYYPGPSRSYEIEVARMSATDLREAKAIDGTDALAVDALLAQHPLGSQTLAVSGTPVEATETMAPSVAPDAEYRVIIYNGRLSSELMAQAGIAVGVGEHPEVEAWVCEGIVLRVIRNPNLLGRRPYRVASFAPIPGSVWGRSLPDILSDVQRMCNAVMRALPRNLAFSAGPIGEYDRNRLEGEADIEQIVPGRMYGAQNDPLVPNRSPALRFQLIPSYAQQLLAVHAAFLKLADDVSGIPAYALGNPQTAGAGRTLGGLSLLMGNAAKGLKAVLGHIDSNVIEPMVSDVYMALMTEKGVPEEDKVDVRVVAQGSQGLLQRELTRGNAVEALQIAVPLRSDGTVTREGVQYLVREVVSSLGFDPDKVVPDPAREKQLRAVGPDDTQTVASSPPNAAAPGTPVPSLDARSATPPDPADLVRVPTDVG
jgi:hypothetical protein